jgi:D-alanyl-D-alanine carboxypeptidase
MGFAVGTQVTLDNAIKMLMVKSANDMAVVIAEGVSGSVEAFANDMNQAAARIGMTQSSFVNPNGLPADGQITSARDLAILTRTVYRELPEYEMYWRIPAIKFGKRVMRNYNRLIDNFPGADGMKTGFICASGFNLVASASRNGRRLVAVVFGSYSSAVRAQKAAQLLENGFNNSGLSWLTPSCGTVEQLKPIDAQPPNLREEMCGAHRRKPPSEENDEDQAATGDGSEQNYQLSALKPAHEKFVLGPALIQPEPVVVFTGPPGNPDQVEQTAAAPAKKAKKKAVAKKDDAAPAENKDAKPKTAAKKDGAAPKEAKKEGDAAAKPAAKKPAPKKDKAAAAAPAQ